MAKITTVKIFTAQARGVDSIAHYFVQSKVGWYSVDQHHFDQTARWLRSIFWPKLFVLLWASHKWPDLTLTLSQKLLSLIFFRIMSYWNIERGCEGNEKKKKHFFFNFFSKLQFLSLFYVQSPSMIASWFKPKKLPKKSFKSLKIQGNTQMYQLSRLPLWGHLSPPGGLANAGA